MEKEPTIPIDIEVELCKDNPKARAIDIRMHANALRVYLDASRNIQVNGAICQHPRTGAPIENPFLKVQAAQAAFLSKQRNLKSDRVLALLDAE